MKSSKLYLNARKKLKKIKLLRYVYHFPKDILIHSMDFIEIFLIKFKKINTHKEIKKLENIHQGERCFIIGNGPSLTVEDLEKISTEVTFASNRIYGIYNQTKWRPTYYCSADPNFAKAVKQDFVEVINSSKMSFLNLRCTNDYPKEIIGNTSVYFYFIPKVWGIHFLQNENSNKLPKFSNNFSKRAYSGATITYEMIQLAVYMGFKEIYLIGVDHQYTQYVENGVVKVDLTLKSSYFKGVAEINEGQYIMNTTNSVFNPRTTLAYQAAKDYAQQKNICIKNATRDGKLEVFERVNLEEIIKK
ncbi:6-hydroxymethylpterin diphosphokinase MptE-like protein [Paenibacillus cremeus]|uniref:DUF115 domain-containing protein n=1 Tax=Paenibacillus cremeus TaxID=2163881 RepID=A0A559K544_9BACL|nr:6-hydroxymethylpterin diphosphokinase MptE-like protein [Paenibacillus cremeus]TVY07213.1 DUF115 domain-containing protein [Paenibacillus cremeus]